MRIFARSQFKLKLSKLKDKTAAKKKKTTTNPPLNEQRDGQNFNHTNKIANDINFAFEIGSRSKNNNNKANEEKKCEKLNIPTHVTLSIYFIRI